MTHLIPADAKPFLHGQARARCGELVNRCDHAVPPECPACLALDAEDAAAIDALREGPAPEAGAPDPFRSFNPTAGYRPRPEGSVARG